MSNPEKPERGGSRDYIRYAGLGFEILVAMCLFVGGGYALDQWLMTEKPWFTLGFSLLGCIVSIYLMIRVVSKKN